jgi:ABC-2 type transport system permease protein
MQRLRFLIWKEFLELRKDPKLFGVVVVAPIVQLTMLGYAATTDVRDVPVVVVDADRSPSSRELIARFEGSRNFSIVGVVRTAREVEPFLEKVICVARALHSCPVTARPCGRDAGQASAHRGRQRLELDYGGA